MTAALILGAFILGAFAHRLLMLRRLRKWTDGALDAESAHDRRWTAIRVRQAILRTRSWA